MLLRLHFSVEDLAKVSVARAPDPLWETVLGLQQLTSASPSSAACRTELRHAKDLVEQRQLSGLVRLLATLVPSSGYFPDFLTPTETSAGLAAGLDAMRATPAEFLKREVRQLVAATPPPPASMPWLRGLAHGDRDRMADLTDALRSVYNVLTDAGGAAAEALIEADRDRRATALREGGVHGLLGSFAPIARWQPPVLHVNYPVDRDIHLDGRGLRLVPSYFCQRMPITLADPELQPVLVYPVRDTDQAVTTKNLSAPLLDLLGRTRAGVLVAVRSTSTTGEIALRLRVSPASASEHVHVLTAANLVRSQRAGNQVLHTLTPLGAAMLNGSLGRWLLPR